SFLDPHFVRECPFPRHPVHERIESAKALVALLSSPPYRQAVEATSGKRNALPEVVDIGLVLRETLSLLEERIAAHKRCNDTRLSEALEVRYSELLATSRTRFMRDSAEFLITERETSPHWSETAKIFWELLDLRASRHQPSPTITSNYREAIQEV